MSKHIFVGFISPQDTHGTNLYGSDAIYREVRNTVLDNITGRDLNIGIAHDKDTDGGIAVLRIEVPFTLDDEDQRFFIEFLTEVCGALKELRPHFTEELPAIFFEEVK